MMYMVFLAFLYMVQGGRLWSFILSALGKDVEEDETPPTPVAGQKQSQATGTDNGYASGKDVRKRSLSFDRGEVVGSEGRKPLLRSGSAMGTIGGTFSSSYKKIPGDIEDGKALFRSMSVNSDSGQGKILPRTMSINSDGEGPAVAAPATTEETCGAKVGGQQWFLSKKDRQTLKRRTIVARFTPFVFLSSFVSDLDLITDWCFLRFGLAGQGYFIQQAALFFAIIGTIMWALSTTEFALMSKFKAMWKNNPISRLEHVGLGWQLLANVFLEDLPQFVITVITRPTSVTGVLNLSTSGLSLSAKIVHGLLSQRVPSLSTQFKMIDQDPAVTRNLFKLRDEAKHKAVKAEKLVYLAWTNRCATQEAKAAAVFQILQIDPTFVNGDLEYMRADLVHGSKMSITSCSLAGSIPPQLGGMTIIKTIILSGNQLSGSIPDELGNLTALRELDLSQNDLSGPIPIELGSLSDLRILTLSKNSLSGVIPVGLGALDLLTSLDLSHNDIAGEIPPELGNLSVLENLDLSHNELTGEIPPELGNLSVLENLDLSHNKLTGLIPEELGSLASLRVLSLGDNMLSGVEEAEACLEAELHPDCQTDFLPQQEQDSD